MSEWLNQRLPLCVGIGLLMGVAVVFAILEFLLPFLWFIYVA